jgi:hypothetical protein
MHALLWELAILFGVHEQLAPKMGDDGSSVTFGRIIGLPLFLAGLDAFLLLLAELAFSRHCVLSVSCEKMRISATNAQNSETGDAQPWRKRMNGPSA